MTREVGIFKVKDDEKYMVRAALPRVNLHHYKGKGHPRKFDVKRDDRSGFLTFSLTQKGSGIRVYKEGCTTSKTFGVLTNIHFSMKDA